MERIKVSFLIKPEHAQSLAALYELLECDEVGSLMAMDAAMLWFWLDTFLDCEEERNFADLKKVLIRIVEKIDS